MTRYVELPREKITFSGNTEEEKKTSELIFDLTLENGALREENKELKQELKYLQSGEYYNQLRFERDMLQNIVDNCEVSKEDKEFIDMTHRNTELLEQLQERDNVIDKAIEYMKDFIFEPLLINEDRKLIMFNQNLKNFEDILKGEDND